MELTDAEASIMLALWTNGGKNRLFDEEEGKDYTNEVRKSHGLGLLSMEQYRRSLSQLSRLRCVELRDGTARVRERVSKAR